MSKGELYVTGRLKDTIIVRGRNFDPTPIEVAAGRVDGVRTGNVAAFSISGDLTEKIVVVAESREGDPEAIESDMSASRRARWCSSRRALCQRPRAASSNVRRLGISTSTVRSAACGAVRMCRPLLE
jgi:fatty-acyl-CoA synthase